MTTTRACCARACQCANANEKMREVHEDDERDKKLSHNLSFLVTTILASRCTYTIFTEEIANHQHHVKTLL